MSRIGQMPIPIPNGVQVDIQGNRVTVKGPKGALSREFHRDMIIRLEGDQLLVTRPSDSRTHRALHGLTRALLANMVEGVTQGYRKALQIEGIGYRVGLQGQDLVLQVGFSHPVRVSPPSGISFDVERGGRIFYVDGVDKELVGKVAAEIRAIKKPDPYKGKGIRYLDEPIRRKAGKAGKVAAG